MYDEIDIKRIQGDTFDFVFPVTVDGAPADFSTITSASLDYKNGSTSGSIAGSGDASGNLSFSPSASDVSGVGVYDYSVTVSDSNGKTHTYVIGTLEYIKKP